MREHSTGVSQERHARTLDRRVGRERHAQHSTGVNQERWGLR